MNNLKPQLVKLAQVFVPMLIVVIGLAIHWYTWRYGLNGKAERVEVIEMKTKVRRMR